MEEIERRMRVLEEVRRNFRLDQKIPKCKVGDSDGTNNPERKSNYKSQVCLQTFPRDGEVYSCFGGHFICGSCCSQDALKLETDWEKFGNLNRNISRCVLGAEESSVRESGTLRITSISCGDDFSLLTSERVEEMKLDSRFNTFLMHPLIYW